MNDPLQQWRCRRHFNGDKDDNLTINHFRILSETAAATRIKAIARETDFSINNNNKAKFAINNNTAIEVID